MADPKYTDYDADPDANRSGTSPKRMPEGNYKGSWVNDTFRWMAAVIRRLGDAAAKLPLDDDGAPDTTNGEHVGTLAFQDADAVAITGGQVTARGYAFVKAVIAYDGTWAEYLEDYDALFAQGWVVCDGRTVTNPYTSASVTLPDYRKRYLRMFEDSATAGQLYGADTQTTSTNGAHTHGGSTGTTALTAAQLPLRLAAQPKSGDLDLISGALAQTAAGHTHSIASNGDHTHTVAMAPLSVNTIWLKRVW